MKRRPHIGGQDAVEWRGFLRAVVTYTERTDWEIRSYLEVGAREGHALAHLVDTIDSIDTVRVIDWPGQDWGRVGSEVHLTNNLDRLRDERKVDCDVFWYDSTDPESLAWASQWAPYDLCLIDASHVYEDVLSDFNFYFPLSKITALHDINHPPDSRAYGPTKLWRELVDSGRYRTAEIIAEGSRKGIGFIVND